MHVCTSYECILQVSNTEALPSILKYFPVCKQEAVVDQNLAIPTGLSLIIDAYRVTITDTLAFSKHTYKHTQKRAQPQLYRVG